MKVMIVPEDPVLDQYVLKPIVERMFEELGRRARVQVLASPRLRGVAQALDRQILDRVISQYPMVDVFVVMVDRDGVESREAEARAREVHHEGRLFVCLAVEEVEVWMLALHRERLGTPWKEVRADRDPKERFAHPLLAQLAPKVAVGGGRVRAMEPLGQRWRSLRQLCPELAHLEQRLAQWLAAR
ncbi:MAG: hypothetical protein AB1Z98_08455 [Nannocystaceae bacterium]